MEVLKEAQSKYGGTEIVNMEQGSQVISFTDVVLGTGAKLSMDCLDAGGWREDVFVERLWKTVNTSGST